MDLTPSKEGPRVNEDIAVANVRLVDEDGENVGVVPTPDAIERALNVGLDLVEVSPGADPPAKPAPLRRTPPDMTELRSGLQARP